MKVIGGMFHMWYIFGTGWKRFSVNSAPDRIYKIGHAVSADGISWLKEEALQIIGDRLGADESQALPTVVEIGGRYNMSESQASGVTSSSGSSSSRVQFTKSSE